MKIVDKERLTRHRDYSPEAISWRLQAAIKAAKIAQKTIATELDKPLSTINSQIKSGSPSNELMVYLYKSQRIDFNFVIFGDFAQLPSDVEAKLLDALSALERSENSRNS